MDLMAAVAELRQRLPAREWAAVERLGLAVVQEAAVDRETADLLAKLAAGQ